MQARSLKLELFKNDITGISEYTSKYYIIIYYFENKIDQKPAKSIHIHQII